MVSKAAERSRRQRQDNFCEPIAFIGLTIHAKIIGGGRPLLPEIFGHSDRVGVKSPIFDLFFRS